ncbi:MAG: hypothetical protein AAF915_04445 [Cyanobacteria bacterium P01_D01_bin.50]
MKETSNLDLMTERLESLKAAIICALSFSLVFILASIFNHSLLKDYFHNFYNLSTITRNWQWLISTGIAGFSGFLFGITYRYIIRQDENPQLKAGSVFAFGLVRALTQVDMGINFSLSVVPVVLLALESILGFVVAAFTLDSAIKFGWVKPFISSR